MTEYEKIAYAKMFIDKLANGINPLDDSPIPEEDIANNVRLSRCFFYVSGILQKEMDRERKKIPKEPKETKPKRAPFSITREQLEQFQYVSYPISASAIARKINFLVQEDIDAKKIKSLSHKQITHWMVSIGMIEYRKWEDGTSKRFPSVDGEAIGLVAGEWESYGRRIPVVYYTEEAQRFIIDHLDAIVQVDVHTTDADAGQEE